MRRKMRQLAVRRIRSVVGRDEEELMQRIIYTWAARMYQYGLCQQPESSLELKLSAQVRQLEQKLERVVRYVTGTPLAVGLGASGAG